MSKQILLPKMPQNLAELPENIKYMVEIEKNPNYPDGIIPDEFPNLW